MLYVKEMMKAEIQGWERRIRIIYYKVLTLPVKWYSVTSKWT